MAKQVHVTLTEKGKAALFGNFRAELNMPELLRGVALLGSRGEFAPSGQNAGGAAIYTIGPREVKRVIGFLDGEVGRHITRGRAMAALWRAEKEIERIEKESPGVDLSEAQVSLNEADLILNGEGEAESFDFREGWERAEEALSLAAAAELEFLGQMASELCEKQNRGEDVRERIRQAYGEVGGLEGALQLRRLIAELQPPVPAYRGRGYEHRTANAR